MFTSYVQTATTQAQGLYRHSNNLLIDVLIQLIQFIHNAFSQFVDVLDFGLVHPFL